MNAALCTAFFLSGVAGLVFETLWFRQAGLALGNSIWASSLVLAAFMGGLAVGNGLTARLHDRITRPLRLYVLLEATIAVLGVSLVWLLPALTPALALVLRPLQEQPWLLNAVRLSIGFTLLLLPAAAMGATLPVLVNALFQHDSRFGAVLGRLYGWNTLGAVTGAIVGEALLIGWFGIRGTAWVAASLNGLALLIALAVARREEPANPQPASRTSAQTGPAARLSPRARRILWASAVSGAGLLGLEVVWFRFLLLSVSGTGLAFAVMLAVVLAGIGVGGLIGARWLGRRPDAQAHASAVAFACGAICVATYALFDFAPRSFGGRAAHDGWETLQLALPLMALPALLSGVLFTLLGEALQREAPNATRSAALLTLANTLGSMLGSLGAGFLLLPGLGVEASIALLCASYGLTGGLALPARSQERERAARVASVITAIALLATLLFFPRGFMEKRYLREPIDRFVQMQPVLIREALTETIIYLQRDLFGEPYSWRLVTNSHSMSSTATRDQRYMTVFVTLPVAFRPKLESALLISYGVGVTAKALTDQPQLQRIDVVDISRDILAANRIVEWAGEPGGYPLDDPRVRVHVEDGRHFLQTTDRHFDLITGEPPPPKLAGVVSLYTQEYFGLVHERLSEGGITSYWLPVTGLLESEAKSIIQAFCAVFVRCSLWSGAGLDWVLIGTRGELLPPGQDAIAAQWRDPLVTPRLREFGLERAEQLGALFLADAEQLRDLVGDTPPLDDDHPKRMGDAIPRPPEFFREWMQADRARERFVSSRFIDALWPPPLRDAALASFDDQHWIDLALSHKTRDFVESLPGLHRILTRTPLETLPAWILGSDVAAARAADRAHAAGREGLGIDFHRAVAALATRRPAEAAALFLSARRRPLAATNRDLVYLEIYSLCLAERLDEARVLAGKAGLASGRRETDTEFNAFLEAHFD